MATFMAAGLLAICHTKGQGKSQEKGQEKGKVGKK
jgi:hypothetical protein